jgi:sulfatase maturation enzyme AslB (radical SAM superfamily)
MFTVSINPSYFCNFGCNFCYLTPEQLSDTKKINIDRLDELLAGIPSIQHVDLYGGEIGALKKDYFYQLKDTIRNHYTGDINIITNYSMIHDGFYEDDVYLSVSYDFEAREKSELVYKNMLLSPVPIAVLILASPKVLSMDVEEMIMMLNMCSSIDSVEIKPYSTNQANSFNVSHRDFEQFIIKWLTAKTPKKFQFINEQKIEESYTKQYNAFSDNHIYITPNGKYGVLEFDKYDREYFLELDTWQEYLDWANKEKLQLSDICKQCNYYGTCLTEHYRYVDTLDQSCNGYKGLLDWYGNARVES